MPDKTASEIRSLISLLDDEEQIYTSAKERLLSYGESALPFLPFVESVNTLSEKRILEIRDFLIRKKFKDEFRNLKQNEQGEIDLEDGIFLIVKQRFTDIDCAKYIAMLDALALELREKLTSITDETEIFRRVIEFFVDEKKFTGNSTDYYNEDNQYINRVLDTRLGIPITLSAVYLLVAKRINLPISGIGIPGHFTLRFLFSNATIYFDPFNNGKILSQQECEEMVRSLGFAFSEDYFLPISNRKILERMLRNIILSLEKKNQSERIETIRQFIDSLNSDL